MPFVSLEEEVTSGFQPLEEMPEDEITPPQEQKSFLQKAGGVAKRVGSAITRNERAFGESLAGAAIADGGTASDVLRGGIDLITGGKATETKNAITEARRADAERVRKIYELAQNVKERRARGEDVTRSAAVLKSLIDEGPIDDSHLNPALKKTNRQIIGEALGVATDIIGAGTIGGKGAGLVTKPTSFASGAYQGLKAGATTGGAFGALQGASSGLQGNKDAEGVVKDTLAGGVGGAVIGGGIGATVGGISGALRGRQIRKLELQNLVDSGELSNKKLASIDPTTMKTDPKAAEALKQGFDESDVAVFKSMSESDKRKALRMLDIADRASKNKRVIDRPMDVVGETILEPAQHLSNKLKEASSQLDEVAQSLKGAPVERLDDVIAQIDDDLASIGATPRGGTIDFKGSTLEGVGGNEKILNNVYKRMTEANDAYDLHRLKKYIDNNVSYGKTSEGLVGESESLLKAWRRSIDGALDSQFPDYDAVNTVLHDSIGQLDELNSVMGRSFNVNNPTADIKAGSVASKILTNSPNRGDVLKVLDTLQQTAKKYGYESSDDVINQVIFADGLEDLYGTQATRSLGGNIERFTKGVGVAKDVAEGNFLKAGMGALGDTAKGVRGISQEAKIKALRDLISDGVSVEGVIEGVEGWKPGMRQMFDSALMRGDKETVRKMLPQIPAEYAKKFAQNISKLLGK